MSKTTLQDHNIPFDPFRFKIFTKESKLVKTLNDFHFCSQNSDFVPSDTWLIYLVLKLNIKFNDDQIKKVLGLDTKDQVHLAIFLGLVKVVQECAARLSVCHVTSLLDLPLTDLKEICYELALHFKALFFVPIRVCSTLRRRPKEPMFISASALVQTFHSAANDSPAHQHSHTEYSSNVTNSRNHHATQYGIPCTSAVYNQARTTGIENEVAEVAELTQFISRYNNMWPIVMLLNREYERIVESFSSC